MAPKGIFINLASSYRYVGVRKKHKPSGNCKRNRGTFDIRVVLLALGSHWDSLQLESLVFSSPQK